MLRAVGVPRRDLEQDHLLGPRLVALRHQRFRQCGIVFHHARLAPDLHAAAVRIIHHENMGFRILRQIALGDVLPVTAVIGKRDGVLVDDFDKALRPAAVLDIGLTVRGSRREKEAVGLGEEAGEIFVDLGAPAAARLDFCVGVARALAGLDRLDRRREGDIAGMGVHV